MEKNVKMVSTVKLETAPEVAHCQVGLADILVVDDNEMMRLLVGEVLKCEGYEVQFAQAGKETLEYLERNCPDLILLDCMMPEMDGFEVCRHIRQNPDFNDVPIIFLTARATSKDKAEGFMVGGADYIVKPVDPTELLARIRTHLELAYSRRQLRQQAQNLERVVSDQSTRLDQVRTGQETLLAKPEGFPEINVAVRFVPAYEAGGDFYDIVRLSENDFGLFVADVAGHDLGTAYLTGALKSLTASFTNETLSVLDTMLMMNASLGKFLDPDVYATASYVKFSRSRMEIELISAGHPSPLFQTNQAEVSPFDLVGDVLGMHDMITCQTKTLNVSQGDRLFLYTDGCIECHPDASGKTGSRQVGMKHFVEKITNKANIPLQEAVETIVDELLRECDGVIGDDVVLLGIEF